MTMALYCNWSKRDAIIKSIAWICNLADIWNHLVVMEKIYNLHRCSLSFISHAIFGVGWVKLLEFLKRHLGYTCSRLLMWMGVSIGIWG
jgi:hypothetical protein